MNLFKNFKLLFLLIINILLLGNQVEGKISTFENGQNAWTARITQMLLNPDADWTTLKGIWVEDNISLGSNKKGDVENEENTKIETQNSIIMYPNPANETLVIESESGEVKIMDLNGKVVLTSKLNSGFTLLDLNTLNSGIFMVQITINNTVNTQKLVIIK